MRRSCVIPVASTADLMTGGVMPRYVENARTGEVFEVVSWSADSLVCVRASRWRRLLARLRR